MKNLLRGSFSTINHNSIAFLLLTLLDKKRMFKKALFPLMIVRSYYGRKNTNKRRKEGP